MDIAILLFALLISSISGLQFLRFNYLIGHDVYFHYYISRQILENGLKYPMTITNYWDGVLYGYPPLLHLLTAISSFYLQIDLFTIYRYIPVVFPGLVIILAYFFFKTYDYRPKFLATLIFALTAAVMVPIYQGEYARLFGFAFSLLGLIYLKRYSSRRKLLDFLIAVTTLSLGIFSNLITTLFIGAMVAYIFLFEFKDRKHAQTLHVILATTVLSSIWWGNISLNFGWDYLIQVLLTHQKTPLVLPITLVFGIVITYQSLRKKQLPELFIVWLWVSCMLLESIYILFPLSLFLAAKLHPYISSWTKYARLCFYLLLTQICALVFINVTNGEVIRHDAFMNQDVLDAAFWVQTHTLEQSSIMAYFTPEFSSIPKLREYTKLKVSLGNRDVSLPPLTNRKVYSWMGYEWNNNPQQLEIYSEFQAKLCLEYLVSTAQKYQIYPTYLWINKDTEAYTDPQMYCRDLHQPGFTPVFENERVLVIEVYWDRLN